MADGASKAPAAADGAPAAPAKGAAMWGGRFDAPPNELVALLGESVSYDRRMYAHDIRGSTAHARMLARQGIIPQADADAIVEGLAAVQAEIEAGTFVWSTALEDVHMNIESRLTGLIGAPGGRLHAARSRNDQVATDMRLYLRDEVAELVRLARALQAALVTLASEHTDTIVPGFTHLQHAQPVVFGHVLLAYVEMLDRDVGRLTDAAKRMDVLPLGAGAMAGTTLPIDRASVADALGFTGGLTRNSMDAVSDRDFAVELVSALSLMMMHLSRLSEDTVFWCSQEAGWVELGDAFCTGSSIMPQKKNPDVCELTRGKAARVYGDLVTLLSLMKNLPLCYNRDMQEDKEPLFDAVDTAKLVLAVYAPMVASIKVRKDRMHAAASDAALMATDLAEWLVRQGLPFRQAHHRVGALVGAAHRAGKGLEKFTLAELRESVPEATEECLGLWMPEASVAARDVVGGTAPSQVRAQVAYWQSQAWMAEAEAGDKA